MPNKLYAPGTVVDSGSLNDFNTSTYDRLTAVAGTNTITATGPLSMTAYAAGQSFWLVPAITNSGAVTINISGLGARAVTKNGATALIAGELVAGTSYELFYDGTQFQVQNPTVTVVFPNQPGRLIGVQRFTSNGTYTPTAGTISVVVDACGAGGGGGGTGVTAAGQISTGSGGGGGAHTIGRFTSAFSGVAVTVGAGGAGVAGAAGTAGTASSFGALLTAPGGNGGGVGATGAVLSVVSGVDGGVVGTGGNILAQPGNGSDVAYATSSVGGFSTPGGASPFGGRLRSNAVGGTGLAGLSASVIPGAGGGGAWANQNQPGLAGGAGGPGLVIVYEYA